MSMNRPKLIEITKLDKTDISAKLSSLVPLYHASQIGKCVARATIPTYLPTDRREKPKALR